MHTPPELNSSELRLIKLLLAGAAACQKKLRSFVVLLRFLEIGMPLFDLGHVQHIVEASSDSPVHRGAPEPVDTGHAVGQGQFQLDGRNVNNRLTGFPLGSDVGQNCVNFALDFRTYGDFFEREERSHGFRY